MESTENAPSDVLTRHITVRVSRDDKEWLARRAAALTRSQRPAGARRVTEADVVRIAVAEMRARAEGGKADG